MSYAHPAQVRRCHEIGQSVMLDNGAFSVWNSGKSPDFNGFYSWAEEWLDCPTTWGVIPDHIAGDEGDNKRLALACPMPRGKMAPVWHLHESLDYLAFLVDGWPRVCFGSSADYSQVGSHAWHRRVQEAFDHVWDRKPWIHMLRGMRCSEMPYPFGSVDSTDVARNHHAAKNGNDRAMAMADRWDQAQCPTTFTRQPKHQLLMEIA